MSATRHTENSSLVSAARVIANAQTPSIEKILRVHGYEWEANAIRKLIEALSDDEKTL
jgi:hypothetical protein